MQNQHFPDIKERITDLLRNKKTGLPTLPVVVQNIIRISRDDSTSAADLAAFINNDQAIANKVLRLANSPYYGRSGKVDSILRAITIIGFDEIVSIAIGIGLFPSLKASGIGQLLNVRQLWLHAIGSTFAARAIAEHLNGGRGGKAQSGNGDQKSIFLTALFHDMGKVLFLIYFHKEYREVLEKSAAEQLPLQRVEELLLGVDHGQLAARIM
ncbi:MAG: HDOD domain-containing protein, partial [Thermodesulfobacteriota bacterium]